MLFLLTSLLLTSALDIYDFNAPKVFANFVHTKMTDQGYAILSDASLANPIVVSETLKEVNFFYPQVEDFSYALGNVQGRAAIAPGIHKIGGAPKQVLVSGHSEASYLNLSPRFLTFTCFQEAEQGGQTPVYNIQEMEYLMLNNSVGEKLYNDVFEHGVTYIRNDVSADGPLAKAWDDINYPTWQARFPGQSKQEILQTLQENGMAAYFDVHDTLHSEWQFTGFRAHPDNGRMVWFNQLYAMNGRYWRQHGNEEILAMPLNARPLSSRIGTLQNNREMTEAEYTLIDNIHFQTQQTFDWRNGRVMFVDNFEFQHGRLPYEGERKCAVGWGPSVPVDLFVTKSIDDQMLFDAASDGVVLNVATKKTSTQTAQMWFNAIS